MNAYSSRRKIFMPINKNYWFFLLLTGLVGFSPVIVNYKKKCCHVLIRNRNSMATNSAASFRTVQTLISYQFKTIKLLEEALTHDSHRVNNATIPTYQRLEFLGDSVLNLVITEYLFRNNPNLTEGQLTAQRKELTEGKKQTEIAREINLQDHVSFGISVNRNQFSRFGSFVESLIGAVYIDGGLEAARGVIYHLWKITNNAGSVCVIS